MTALVSVVLSYAALAAVTPGANPSANTCTPKTDTCEASFPVDEPETYATPAEVDCRAAARVTAAAGRAELQLFSGTCTFPVFDFRYRVSRLPDSERPVGSLRPQRRHRTAQPVATTSGLPNEPRGLTSTTSAQPIAVYALTALMPPICAQIRYDSNRRAPRRTVEPLDRPPRA